MDNFNKLTPAETERLAKLSEECGEVVQIVGKILRHGYESYHPNDSERTTNRELLMREIGDLLYIFAIMTDAEDIDHVHTEFLGLQAVDRPHYFHHQDIEA